MPYHAVVRMIDCKDCPTQTCSAVGSLADSFPPCLSFFRLICAILDVLELFRQESLFFFRAVQLTAKIINLRLQIRGRRCRGVVSWRSIWIFFRFLHWRL